ncbi:MAG: hypothetical protein AB1540_01210 [Bdellovibrionota bacterium]
MFSRILFVLLATILVGVGCGKKKDEKAGENGTQPAMSLDLQSGSNLYDLMARHSRAVVSPQPWAGYWWPYVGQGIASTWRDGSGMSPADKYDAAYKIFLESRGANTAEYKSMAAWERTRHGPGLANVESWWGHCNGWAAASLMVPEPTAPKVINGIRFEVRDLKAILSESWMEFSGDFVGNRVNAPGDTGSAAYWDIAPAQFHLLLAHKVGRQNRGLILDRHTGHEIWNQPLVAYKFEPITPDDYLGAHPSFPEIHRVNVTAKIWWANDNVAPDMTTGAFNMEESEFTSNQYFPRRDAPFHGRKLRYELWLDAPAEFDEAGNLIRSGDILITEEDGRYVGGVWKNGSHGSINAHPDYMWMPHGIQHSSGYKNPRLDDAWVREYIGTPHHGS